MMATRPRSNNLRTMLALNTLARESPASSTSGTSPDTEVTARRPVVENLRSSCLVLGQIQSHEKRPGQGPVTDNRVRTLRSVDTGKRDRSDGNCTSPGLPT